VFKKEIFKMGTTNSRRSLVPPRKNDGTRSGYKNKEAGSQLSSERGMKVTWKLIPREGPM